MENMKDHRGRLRFLMEYVGAMGLVWLCLGSMTDAMQYNDTSIKQAVRDCLDRDDTGISCGMENWDTSLVTDMEGLFLNYHFFNAPIGNWNTSSVTTMKEMFWYALTFNQSIQFNRFHRSDRLE